MFKRKATALWAAVCALALITACGAGAVGLPNPVRDVTAEELQAETGVSFPLPEAAREATYSIIEVQGEEDISQAQFTLEGVRYCCRMQSGDERRDISGMYYEWAAEDSVDMANAQAEARYNQGEAGIILWYSGIRGLACSVSMDTGATLEALGAIATTIDAGQGPKDDDGRRGVEYDYDIQENTDLTVRLPANPTTGYQWTFQISRETALRCEQEEYVPDENPQGLVGSGGTYVATFSPTMQDGGWVNLRFRYVREWEPEEPAQTYVFRLWIDEAGLLSVEGVD